MTAVAAAAPAALPRGAAVLRCEFWTPAPVADVWPFFADAGNLQELTPPWLDFRILTPRPIPMHVDARIEYRIRIRGIPVRWRTRIAAWQPLVRFVDEQEKGPEVFIHERECMSINCARLTEHPSTIAKKREDMTSRFMGKLL